MADRDEAQTRPQEENDPLTNRLVFIGLAIAAIVWWDGLKSIGIFLVTLGILIAVHEWGHFIAAKSVGVHVYEFALGWFHKVCTYMRRGGTDYTLRVVPIGGFVIIKGTQPDDPITPDGLNGRRASERALVYLAGPLMNVILGVTLLMLAPAVFGTTDESQYLVGSITRKKPATRMTVVSKNGEPVSGMPPGLRVGDRIVAINGRRIDRREAVTAEIHPNAGKQITMTVVREKDELMLTGIPEPNPVQDKFLFIKAVPEATDLAVRPGDQLQRIDDAYLGDEKETPQQAAERLLREKSGTPVTLTVWRNKRTQLKVTGTAVPLVLETKPGERIVGQFGFAPYPGQGPRVSLGESVRMGAENVVGFGLNMAHMFSRPKQLGESVGGPVEIWAVLSEVNRLPPLYYVNILASLSLSLAVFNLLPMPVLDGGHMLLLTLEVLRRRRLEPETQKKVVLAGFAIIGALLVYITSRDILKHFL